MGHPTMQENDTAKLTPTSFCKKDIDTFIYVLIISDLYY